MICDSGLSGTMCPTVSGGGGASGRSGAGVLRAWATGTTRRLCDWGNSGGASLIRQYSWSRIDQGVSRVRAAPDLATLMGVLEAQIREAARQGASLLARICDFSEWAQTERQCLT